MIGGAYRRLRHSRRPARPPWRAHNVPARSGVVDHLPQETSPVHDGHAIIGNHQIESRVTQPTQRVARVVRNLGAIAEFAKQLAQAAAHVELVIDDQHARVIGTGMGVRRAFGRVCARERQEQAERRAATRTMFVREAAIMGNRRVMGQMQPDTGAGATRIGRGEGVEQPRYQVLGHVGRYRRSRSPRTRHACRR